MNDRQREAAVDAVAKLLQDIDMNEGGSSFSGNFSGFEKYQTPLQMREFARRIIEEIEDRTDL